MTYGVSSNEQEGIVKSFLKNIFKVDVEQLLTAGDFPHHILLNIFLYKRLSFFQVMNEYMDYRQTDDENKITNRDTLLSIFSDARVAAPIVKSALAHGELGNVGNTYLYVFQHVTKYGYYPDKVRRMSRPLLDRVSHHTRNDFFASPSL